MPLIWALGTSWLRALAVRSMSAWARFNAVPIAYRLFSQTNSTGSRHSDARFSDS